MKISGLHREIDGIQLEDASKRSILKVIDYKVDCEMKEVMLMLESIKKEISSQFKILSWMIGILVALIIAILFKG